MISAKIHIDYKSNLYQKPMELIHKHSSLMTVSVHFLSRISHHAFRLRNSVAGCHCNVSVSNVSLFPYMGMFLDSLFGFTDRSCIPFGTSGSYEAFFV